MSHNTATDSRVPYMTVTKKKTMQHAAVKMLNTVGGQGRNFGLKSGGTNSRG